MSKHDARPTPPVPGLNVPVTIEPEDEETWHGQLVHICDHGDIVVVDSRGYIHRMDVEENDVKVAQGHPWVAPREKGRTRGRG